MRIPQACLCRTALSGFMLLAATLPIGACNYVDKAILWPQVERANSQMADAKADCDNKFPPMPGSYLAHARCIDAAQNWIIRPYMAYPDLLARSQTTREKMALMVDNGTMDPGDYTRLTDQEDSPLTVENTTRRGPLTGTVNGNYMALPPQRQNNSCTTSYNFSGC